MDLSDARQRLTGFERHELRDHAFGDSEITWTNGDRIVAEGYFGGQHASVTIAVTDGWFTFDGDDARSLRDCGKLAHVERNDVTGPTEYTEGAMMYGLTKEGVLDEITRNDN